MMRSLRRLVASVLFSRRLFEFLQRRGIHLIRNVPFQPVPDTRDLAGRKNFWDKPSELPGVNLSFEGQLRFLREVLPRYAEEVVFPTHATKVPFEYYTDNTMFGELSAALLHTMIRHHSPRTILEIGSGLSTLAAARACRLNQQDGHSTELVVIDPHPGEIVRHGFPGLTKLVVEKVENVGVKPFLDLDVGDIMFIDTNHVVKTGGDVCFLYLEVLPRLRPGVLVHIHDIFFPFEYPREFVVERHHFYSEQYLLQTYLAHNNAYEVLWCESYMKWKYAQELDSVLPSLSSRIDKNQASSFWMKRVR